MLIQGLKKEKKPFQKGFIKNYHSTKQFLRTCFQVKRQSSFFSPQAVGEHHIAEAGRFLYGWADDGGANVL